MVANILPTDTPPPPRPFGRESRMKQHGSKYFAPYPYSPPSPTLGMGSVGQNSTSPTLGMGSVGQNSTFSEQCHVAYLKENQTAATCHMVANILPTDTPPPPRPFGRESRMKQHGSKYFAPYPYSPPSPTLGMGSVGQNSTSPTLGMGSVGQNSTFSEQCHVAYLKENQTAATCHMVANILPTDTPPPPLHLGRESRMQQQLR